MDMDMKSIQESYVAGFQSWPDNIPIGSNVYMWEGWNDARDGTWELPGQQSVPPSISSNKTLGIAALLGAGTGIVFAAWIVYVLLYGWRGMLS